jgi:hypothetical protein
LLGVPSSFFIVFFLARALTRFTTLDASETTSSLAETFPTVLILTFASTPSDLNALLNFFSKGFPPVLHLHLCPKDYCVSPCVQRVVQM